ncbi:MAG: phosphatase PAP2 family protein [Thermomicrobiales bacterium]
MNAIVRFGVVGRRQEGATTERILSGQAVALLLPAFLAALALSAVAAGNGVLAWDVTVSRFLQRAPDTGVGDAAYAVSLLGDTPIMALLGIGLIMALVALRRIGPALFLAAAGLACAANPVLKSVIDSPRPTADLVRVAEESSGQGFPSGHVMKVVLIYGAILLMSREILPRRGPRQIVQAWAVGMIVATGFSRMYVGAHWPSDVVGAYLWSGLLLGLVVIGYRRLATIEGRSLATVIGGARMTAMQASAWSRRIGILGVGILLAAALVMALAGTLAAQASLDDRTWPAQIRAGTCDALAATAFDLNPAGAARSDADDDDDDAAAAGGAYVGAAGATQVATSGTEMRASLDDLLAPPHSVVVTAADGGESVVACGEIGGFPRGDDDLYVGLRASGDSGMTGVALLDGDDDDDDDVEVTIYLTEVAAGPAASPTT